MALHDARAAVVFNEFRKVNWVWLCKNHRLPHTEPNEWWWKMHNAHLTRLLVSMDFSTEKCSTQFNQYQYIQWIYCTFNWILVELVEFGSQSNLIYLCLDCFYSKVLWLHSMESHKCPGSWMSTYLGMSIGKFRNKNEELIAHSNALNPVSDRKWLWIRKDKLPISQKKKELKRRRARISFFIFIARFLCFIVLRNSVIRAVRS